MKKPIPNHYDEFPDLTPDETNHHDSMPNGHTIEHLCDEQNDQPLPDSSLESVPDFNSDEERGQPFQPKLGPLTQALLRKMAQLPATVKSIDPATLTNLSRFILLLKMLWPAVIWLQVLYAIIIMLLLANSLMNQRK